MNTRRRRAAGALVAVVGAFGVTIQQVVGVFGGAPAVVVLAVMWIIVFGGLGAAFASDDAKAQIQDAWMEHGLVSARKLRKVRRELNQAAANTDAAAVRVALRRLRDRGQAELDALEPWCTVEEGSALAAAGRMNDRAMWMLDVVKLMQAHGLSAYATYFSNHSQRKVGEPVHGGDYDFDFYCRIYVQGIEIIDSWLSPQSVLFAQGDSYAAINSANRWSGSG